MAHIWRKETYKPKRNGLHVDINRNSIPAWCSGFLVVTLFLGTLGCDIFTSARGVVRDEEYRPVSGATVRLVKLNTGKTAEMTTGEDGWFQVTIAHGLPVGRFALTVSRRGYVTYRKEVWAREDVGVKIVLARDKDTR